MTDQQQPDELDDQADDQAKAAETPAPEPAEAEAAASTEAGRPLVDDGARPVVDDGGRLATASTESTTLPAAGAVEVDQQRRTVTGLVVPYGPAGRTSRGTFRFSPGSLSWVDASRVKLLVEHNQRESVGYGLEFRETPEGLYGTFYVPPGPAGDAALAEAASKVRDGLSVGVAVDEATELNVSRVGVNAPVDARGALRETSLVSVPAFDDARVSSVAATSVPLVVSGWADVTTTTPGRNRPHMDDDETTTTPPAAPAPSPELVAQFAALLALAGLPSAGVPSTPAPAPASPPVPAPAPAPSLTAGSAFTVASEPATYTFDGTGPSLCVDAWQARMHGDTEARDRLHRYNAELAGGNPASVLALAAVATRETDGPDSFVTPTTYRPDLLREAIDVGRPLFSRLSPITLTNAQPFSLPVEGEFDGVGDHVEGTAHVPEGTLTGGGGTVTPRAVSGAYRLSRELVDSTNPAIDRVALRAMLRDYRRHSEAKVAAALLAATPTATTVATVMDVRNALEDYPGADELPADFLVAGKTFRRTLLNDVDGNDRPQLATYGSTNAIGTVRRVAGQTSYDIDGVPLVRAGSIAATDAYIAEADAILVGESRVQTFRFDEVEGPGIIKLALWAYVCAAVLDTDKVERLTVAVAGA